MAIKKYVSLNNLSSFLENLKTVFAFKAHTHSTSDISDYTVDSALSSTSANPVQNKVLDAEFEAIGTAMNALDLAIDGKANESHTHVIDDVTNLQSTLDAKVPTSRTINGKALSSDITLSAADVSAYTKTQIDAMEFITIEDIDTICGGSIVAASEVTY